MRVAATLSLMLACGASLMAETPMSVHLAALPEPVALALLGVGFVGLGLARKRFRR